MTHRRYVLQLEIEADTELDLQGALELFEEMLVLDGLVSSDTHEKPRWDLRYTYTVDESIAHEEA